MEQEPWIVRFTPFSTSVESSFWVRYCKEKLDTIKLSEEPLLVLGGYSIDGRFEFRERAINHEKLDESIYSNLVAVPGQLIGFNTIEGFQRKDKNQVLKEVFLPLFRQETLLSFILLTHADLKTHKVLYWFACPAVSTKAGCSIRAFKQELIHDIYDEETIELMYKTYQEKVWNSPSPPSYFLYSPSQGCCSFSKENYGVMCDKDGSERVVFGFMDSHGSLSPSHGKETPMGWPLRNLIACLCLQWNLGGKSVQVLSFRPKLCRKPFDPLNIKKDRSILLTLSIPSEADYGNDLKVVGWELNSRGKPGPRWVNLRPLMDENHLAIQAADLNLKLMKWRMIPNLEVDLLKSTKVLLLGAGTLGCNVARTLLGWGIRKITIVDNGVVSYSNPVRQPLFTLKDCNSGDGGGGRAKALAAAEALSLIAADVEAKGYILSIPMPGHSESRESLDGCVEQLDNLVQDSDVVFLLTDTRESRWLPTVLAAAHDKVLINTALGLDSWLVMRHGGDTTMNDSRLGCYFCNDVVAPENSMKNRTLDQQCTVTRPGLAPLASAMAVEMMVSLLHHPLKHRAIAPRSNSLFSPIVHEDDTLNPLGIIPHQIRGSLVSYSMMIPSVPAFTYCTGCSPSVIQAYRNDKFELTHGAVNSHDGSYLDNLSGLQEFRNKSNDIMADMGDHWDDDF
jgi:ubiquitin-like modifier-activating enzyme ATG7